MAKREKIMERLVRLKDLDRSFDIAFWQAQSSTERFSAAWDLALFAHRKTGKNADELRLQRSVENLQRREG